VRLPDVGFLGLRCFNSARKDGYMKIDKGRLVRALDDPDVARWHANLAERSELTADIYAKRLNRFCDEFKTSPSEGNSKGKIKSCPKCNDPMNEARPFHAILRLRRDRGVDVNASLAVEVFVCRGLRMYELPLLGILKRRKTGRRGVIPKLSKSMR